MIYHEFSKDYYLENIICGNGYTIIVEAPIEKKKSILNEDEVELNYLKEEK
jgi:hypothetical protein